MARSVPEKLHLGPADALIVVDVQRDFLPGGALAVPGGDQIVPVLNRYLGLFAARGLPVFATRDWHPANHCSFHAQGGPWPSHCVADSPGAEFAPELALPEGVETVSKATDAAREEYSDFENTTMDARLRSRGVRRLFIGGLATEYCVRATVCDALARDYAVMLLVDAIRAIDAHPGDGQGALDQMIEHGARPVRWEDVA